MPNILKIRRVLMILIKSKAEVLNLWCSKKTIKENANFIGFSWGAAFQAKKRFNLKAKPQSRIKPLWSNL